MSNDYSQGINPPLFAPAGSTSGGNQPGDPPAWLMEGNDPLDVDLLAEYLLDDGKPAPNGMTFDFRYVCHFLAVASFIYTVSMYTWHPLMNRFFSLCEASIPGVIIPATLFPLSKVKTADFLHLRNPATLISSLLNSSTCSRRSNI